MRTLISLTFMVLLAVPAFGSERSDAQSSHTAIPVVSSAIPATSQSLVSARAKSDATSYQNRSDIQGEMTFSPAMVAKLKAMGINDPNGVLESSSASDQDSTTSTIITQPRIDPMLKEVSRKERGVYQLRSQRSDVYRQIKTLGPKIAALEAERRRTPENVTDMSYTSGSWQNNNNRGGGTYSGSTARQVPNPKYQALVKEIERLTNEKQSLEQLGKDIDQEVLHIQRGD